MSPSLGGRLRGIVFLGTPHQGTSYSQYGILVSSLLSPLDPDVQTMRLLRGETEELEGLQRQFEKLHRDTPRKYFYETDKTYRYLFGFIPLIQEYVSQGARFPSRV